MAFLARRVRRGYALLALSLALALALAAVLTLAMPTSAKAAPIKITNALPMTRQTAAVVMVIVSLRGNELPVKV